MKNRRPTGIIVFGLIGIFIGSVNILQDLSFYPRFSHYCSRDLLFYGAFSTFLALAFIFSSLGLFILKKWARVSFLLSMAVYIIFGILSSYRTICWPMSNMWELKNLNFPKTIIGWGEWFKDLSDPGVVIIVWIVGYVLPAGISFYYFNRKVIKELFA